MLRPNEVSIEDGRILQHRVGLNAWCTYSEGDARDAAMMGELAQRSRGYPRHLATVEWILDEVRS